MEKKIVTSAVAIAFGAALSAAKAEEGKMGKCMITMEKDGKKVGLIKEGKSDCKSATSSCAGQNKAGDASAWIYLPEGACGKIEGGEVVSGK